MRKGLLGAALAIGAGLVIAWIDTRPGWDDTAITAAALLIAAAASAVAGAPAWLAAALVAGPVVVAEFSDGTGVLLAIPFALAGALVGAFVRRRIARAGVSP
jgi:hypothetical protein